jgi:hypothetical protein
VTTPVLPRRQRASLSFREKRWLLSGRPGALIFLAPARVQALWAEFGDQITARHAASHPFARPPNWWRFSAPEPRREGETERAYLRRHPELLLPHETAILRSATWARKASRRQKRAGLAMKINTIDPART